MNGLEFYGYHGCLPGEKVTGQKFVVDVELFLNLQPAALADDLDKTVDYGRLYEAIKDIVEKQRYDLIEAVAQRIADRMLAERLVEKVKVRVLKPEAPINGKFNFFGVEIERERE
ncbi:MAG: dihydroneopterin aldolase [Thermoanaerobacteraceae bacterium]|nr:dihydroneopterin aldolase [Thermoanaerobacteraceae bacterium]